MVKQKSNPDLCDPGPLTLDHGDYYTAEMYESGVEVTCVCVLCYSARVCGCPQVQVSVCVILCEGCICIQLCVLVVL